MSQPSKLFDAKTEIENLSAKEVNERVSEVIENRESPRISLSDRGVAYIRPLDIIASTRAGVILDRHAARKVKM